MSLPRNDMRRLVELADLMRDRDLAKLAAAQRRCTETVQKINDLRSTCWRTEGANHQTPQKGMAPYSGAAAWERFLDQKLDALQHQLAQDKIRQQRAAERATITLGKSKVLNQLAERQKG